MPDERGTSSSCSVCGHEDRDSRVERGLWKYDHCGMVAHGEIRGADNIRQKTLLVIPLLHAGRRSERNDLIDAHVAESRVEIRETSDSHSIDGLAGFVQCSSTLGFPDFFGEAALGCALVTEHQ